MRRRRAALLLLLAVVLAPSPRAGALEGLASSADYYGQLRGRGVSINVYNWGEYISDGSDGMPDVNREFEKLTGIRVYYSTYATNEELYSKLRGGGAAYDVVIPSDYMIGRMIAEDMLLPLDFAQIPNAALTAPEFLDPLYDPGGRHSVPYTWGYVGILYNRELLYDDEEITSWDILWDERYLGEILMFSNPRDAFAIAQARLGYSLNTADPDELAACLRLLQQQKPLVQAYVMDEIFDKMLGGEAALAPYYAGDAVTMMDENESLGFAVPGETVNLFVDGACIPAGAASPQAAQMYINFLCEPRVAAANAAYIGYATPNTAALALLDDEIASNPVAYPPDGVLGKTQAFAPLPREASLLMDRLWTELLSSDERYSRLLVPALLALAVLLSVFINLRRRFSQKKQKKYF